jgi:hypothetical protein
LESANQMNSQSLADNFLFGSADRRWEGWLTSNSTMHNAMKLARGCGMAMFISRLAAACSHFRETQDFQVMCGKESSGERGWHILCMAARRPASNQSNC